MSVDISIVTFTLGGRNKYLIQCLDSVYNDINQQVVKDEIKIEHHLVFQGSYDEELSSFLDYFKPNPSYTLVVHKWPENIGIGAGLNKIIPECKGDLIFKFDDDAKIISGDFFEKALSLHKYLPNAIFSPQPIGLVNNISGPPAVSRQLIHDSNNNEYIMIRNVNHVGGFARFSPRSIFESFKFSPDLIKGISGAEDGNLSQYALSQNIQMFYVETGMVVEHNEGLGQLARYPEYFKYRVGDIQTYQKWII